MALTLNEESQLRSLIARNIDLHGRRVVNAGDAKDPQDYITKRQFDGFTTTKSGLLIPAHADTHQEAGIDEINVTNLHGLLQDEQNPLPHAARHEVGGDDIIPIDTLGAATDNTNLDVSITAHGLVPKAPNDITKFLDGTGAFSVPAGGGGFAPSTYYESQGAQEVDVQNLFGILSGPQDPFPHSDDHGYDGQDPLNIDDLAEPSDNTRLDVNTSRHGLAPKSPNDATKYLDGTGNYSIPSGGGSSLPVIDTTAIVKNVGDNTKQVKIDASQISTGNTRTLTVLDKDYTLEETGHHTKHESTSTDEMDVQGLYGLLEHPQDSYPHGDEHGNDGLDPLHLDDLADPSDNTRLNASTSTHGLLPKLPNDATKFLDGTGNYSAPSTVPGAGWTQTLNEDGTSLTNWTQTSGSWSVASSAFQVNTGATTIRLLTFTTKIAQSAIVYQCDVSLSSSGGFAADNRLGLGFNSDGSNGQNNGALVVLRATGALTPASTGVIFNQQPLGVNNGPTLAYLFNLDTFYTLKVVAIGNVVDIYVNGVYITTRLRFPIVNTTAIEHAYISLYAYNCIANFKNIKLYSITLPV